MKLQETISLFTNQHHHTANRRTHLSRLNNPNILTYTHKHVLASLQNAEPAHHRLLLRIGPEVLPVPKLFNDEEILTSDFPSAVEDVQKLLQLHQAFRARRV